MIDISHQQTQRLLRAHLDTQLPNEQWMMLQAHLETCEPCRTYSERLGVLEKTLRRSLHNGWGSPHSPAGDLERQVLADRQLRAQQRQHLFAITAAAVVIVAVVLLGGPSGIRARFGAARTGQVVETGTPPASLTQAAEESAATLQPTVEPGQFADVIAYQGRRDGKPAGDNEIYLLNPGSDSANLTNNPAQDTDPAWSPDGEWLAFLSDRSQKSEVYVTNITGSRVVQLTDAPGITWQGPLSWSPDGKWIALGGTRDQQGGQNWIYLVGLDGTGERALAGSRYGDSPKFSPSGDRVAYHFSDGSQEGIIVQILETGEQVTAKWEDYPLVPSPAPGSAFDWSVDGRSLAFVSASQNSVANASQLAGEAPSPSGESGSQVLAVRDINSPSAPFTFLTGTFPIDSSRWPGAFRGVSWTPGGAVAYLEDLGSARADGQPGSQPQGCWSVQVSNPVLRGQNDQNQPGSRQASFDGLCVEGGLDRASWTPDGRWIVVKGRLPAEDRLSIYALRMPTSSGRGRAFSPATPFPGNTPPANNGSPSRGNELPGAAAPGTILRLTDDPWPGPLPSPRPRLNRNASLPPINPLPVKKLRSSLPPSNLSSGSSPGKVVYVVQTNTISAVVSANPDGTGGRVLLATSALNRCPTWSPDGNLVAVVQSPDPAPPENSGAGENPLANEITPDHVLNLAGPTGPENVFIINTSTGSLRRVSEAKTIPVTGLQVDRVEYGCPVWSPETASGDRFLATLVRDGQKTFLAILPASMSDPAIDAPPNQPRYLPLGSPVWSIDPVWSPDGQTIYALNSGTRDSPLGMTVVNIPADPQAALTSKAWQPPWRVQRFPGVAILPNGQAIVQLEISSQAGATHLHRIFFSATGRLIETGPAVSLQSGQGQGKNVNILTGSLTWLNGSTFGVILHAGPQGTVKTLFYLYDLDMDRALPLATAEDRITDAAWSPDGHWLIYSAESGLWGVDVLAALQGRSGPVWLSPQPVQGLDWK